MLKEDHAEIKMEVINGLAKLLPVVGAEIITPNLLVSLSNLTKDSNWRVREAAFELLG